MGNPIISVVIPCRNEGKYIGKCLTSLLNQKDVKDIFEILVVDGMSTDSSRSIVNEISINHPQVKLIDNPQHSTPHALNIGIRAAKGEFLAILGSHAEYAHDYLTTCLELINSHPDVSCVGGPIISKGKNSFAKATALAMSNIIGVGNAKHRFPEYEGFSEMACFPVFRKNVFDKYGLYDESLIRNQDDEFCFRLTRAGEKIYISPKAKSAYYVRESSISLFKQYYQYGFWRVAVLKKHKIPISYRQQVPIIFYTLIVLLAILGLIFGNLFLSVVLPVLYLIIIITLSIPLLFKENFAVTFRFPIAVLVLHFSYAVGFFAGMIKFLIIDKLNK